MCNNSNLYLALKEVIVDPASQDMSEVIELDHQFSRRYRRTISRIIGKAEPMTHKRIKMNFKIAVSLVAAVITVGALSVSGGNEYQNLNIEKTERIDYRHGAVEIRYFIRGGTQIIVPPNLYFPTYIPDGLELDEDVSVEESDYFYFTDGYRNLIYTEDSVPVSPSIDTDRHVREKITIHGCEADLFYAADEESTIIIWREGPKVFEISGQQMDKNEVIKVAISVQRRNLK